MYVSIKESTEIKISKQGSLKLHYSSPRATLSYAFDFPIAFGGSPNFNFAFTAGQPPTPVPSLIFLIPSVSLLRFAAATIGELTQYATPISIFVHPVLTPVFQAKNWDNVIPNVVSILVQVFPDTRM